MKKGTLSKIEAHYINSNPGMSNEEIAKELNRSVDIVRKHRIVPQTPKALQLPPEVVVDAPLTQAIKPVNNFMSLSISKDDNGKSKGIAVSTAAASEIADESKSRMVTNRYTKHVGKVFND